MPHEILKFRAPLGRRTRGGTAITPESLYVSPALTVVFDGELRRSRLRRMGELL